MDHWIETLIYVHPQQFKYRYEIQTKKNKTKQNKAKQTNKQKKRTTNKTEEIKKINQIIMALTTVRGVRIIDKSLIV